MNPTDSTDVYPVITMEDCPEKGPARERALLGVAFLHNNLPEVKAAVIADGVLTLRGSEPHVALALSLVESCGAIRAPIDRDF